MDIYFVTGNKGKFKEASMFFPILKQLDIDLPEIQEIDAKAIIKAKLEEAIKHKKGKIIVEDTSLYLDSLNGLPGPLIKWFLESLGDNGLYDIAKKYNNFKAIAKTFIGCIDEKNDISYFKGEIKGSIVAPRGKNGFGWDKIFMPEGFTKTFAEMGVEEKNKISMRRIALKKLKDYLDG